MGDCHPERQVVPARFAERHAAELDADLVLINESSSADSASPSIRAGGLDDAQTRKGRTLCSCSMGTGWEDGELHAVRSDVRLETAETPLSAVREVCMWQLFWEGGCSRCSVRLRCR